MQLLIGVIGVTVIYFVSKGETEVRRIPIPAPQTKARGIINLPSASSILDVKDKLGLSDKQIEKLKRLETEEKLELEPVDAEFKKAEREFSTFMNSVNGKKVSVEEIMSKGYLMSEIGHRQRLLLERYSQISLSVLNKKQKQQILVLVRNQRNTSATTDDIKREKP